ncbi:MAG: carboxypeptidase regulatory-like domain-containing protein [Candidatus Hydrogenedentales bacterium]
MENTGELEPEIADSTDSLMNDVDAMDENDAAAADEMPDVPEGTVTEELVEEAQEEGAAEPQASASNDAAATGGVGSAAVAGLAKFEGEAPKPRPIDVSADQKCAEMHKDNPLLSDAVVISEAGDVANVLVYVSNPPDKQYAAPAEPVVLDQTGCQYVPHILVARVDQEIEIRNSDPLLHNVRSFARRNRPFNMGQPEASPPRMKAYNKPEQEIKIKCDVHPWMTAYLFVMEHPFYSVTDESGKFRIENLPAGTYTLKAWHERMGEVEQEVTVAEGEAIEDVVFTFTRPGEDS